MTAIIAEDRTDLYRWVLSGVIILFAHGAIAASMLRRPPPEEGAPAAAIVIELAPVPVAPVEPPSDLAPTPEHVEAEQPPEQPEEKIVEKIEPKSDDALLPPPPELKTEPPPPQEEEAPPPAPEVLPTRQAAVAAAPTQGAPNASSSNLLPQWKTEIVGMLERNKRYPSAARAHRQHGVARIAFTMDRQGNVTSTRLVRSSGSSLLDREALQIAQRAQPFPAPPPELPGAEITLTVPIRFNLR